MTDPNEFMYATTVQVGKNVLKRMSLEKFDAMAQAHVGDAWRVQGHNVLRVEVFHSAPSYVKHNGDEATEEEHDAVQFLISVWTLP